MGKVCGIYCIENLVNGKKYIGRGVDIHHRWACHRSDLRKGKDSFHLQQAYNIYGPDEFKYYVLEECERDNEILNRLERFYISLYKTYGFNGEFGYNLSEGGLGSMGVKFTDERRKMMSEINSGEKHPNYGKHLSDETKKKIGLANSAIQLRKPSRSNLGKKSPSSASQYYGVVKTNGKWSAQFRMNGIFHYVGVFKSDIDAANAYNDYIIKNEIDRPLNVIK